ncbi:MAG TPA: ROK family protein [Gemmatimonadales bacterium]|nr:ROK family protein [Gemmatimonadales bacterium]
MRDASASRDGSLTALRSGPIRALLAHLLEGGLVMPMQIGIDLGGTKIEAIGLEGQRLAAGRRRLATPREYAGTLDAIERLVLEIEAETGRSATVGIGIPGVVGHATGLVKNANSTWLNGRPLLADLERRLARPVRLANDANCFTLSEAIDGAGREFETVFGVILGTGVGGGIAIRQRIHEGPNQIAGEWGHNPLPWMTDEERTDAAECYCGKVGCIETFLSGPAFEREHARVSGRQCSSEDIVRAAASHEPSALLSLERYVDRLARALASVLNLLDPDAVVLGGGMSNLPDLSSAVAAALPKYLFSDSAFTQIVLNVHGDSSGVRGAAWLWPADEHERG